MPNANTTRKNPAPLAALLALCALPSLAPVARAQTAPAAPAAAPATEAAPAKADPAAYALLKAAHDARQVLPTDFPGFTANLTFNNGGREFKGTLRYKPGEPSQVKFDGLSKEDADWAEDQVLSIIGHRRGGDFAKGDGRFPLTLGADDGSAFGRLVNLNDRLKSSYRVRDNRVTEVTRVMQDTRFTISVLETLTTEGGKYLPKHFVVAYRDAKSGALQLVQVFRDRYALIGNVWLPLERQVTSIEPGEVTPRERTLKFSEVQVLPAQPQAAPQAVP